MHVVPVRRRTHLVAEPGGEVGCICERCFLEVEGRGVDLGWGGSALVRPRRRLTHQDHPEIVGDLLSLGIVDQEMGGQAVVEVGGDALVGVLRREGGDGRGGGVLVGRRRRLGEVAGGRAGGGDGDAAA